MKVVIIGAGQTGRGFVAPFIHRAKHDIVFIDQDQNLIRRLRAAGKYRVNYFGDVRPAAEIDGFAAYWTEEPQAARAVAEADLATTSVFAHRIETLIPLLRMGIAKRSKAEKLQIVCVENGVHVKQPLIDAALDASISEGVIFCTAVGDRESLDITSQSYPNLPVDGSVPGVHFAIDGMPLIEGFPCLIKRKIYTYNFLSAAIAYLGSYAGYEIYAEAASDARVLRAIDQLVGPLNRLISKRYRVSLAEQTEFTALAIEKFRNPFIADSILRNARQAARKLEERERILSPIRFALEGGLSTAYFSLVAAAALYYAYAKEDADVSAQIAKIRAAIREDAVVDEILSLYSLFAQKEELTLILQRAET